MKEMFSTNLVAMCVPTNCTEDVNQDVHEGVVNTNLCSASTVVKEHRGSKHLELLTAEGADGEADLREGM